MARKRRCRYCKEYKVAEDGIVINGGFYCGRDHAAKYAVERHGKALNKLRNSKLKERKEKMKTRKEWMKEAQAAFNRYIRIRDMNKPCISSGRRLDAGSVGGGFDCGHYRSVGSAPHLRFNVFNAHGQSKHDNRYLSGNVAEYRVRLIERIGLERVEMLESDNSIRKFDVEYLKRIKRIFTKKANLYEKRFR